jgi:hypothetical protein
VVGLATERTAVQTAVSIAAEPHDEAGTFPAAKRQDLVQKIAGVRESSSDAHAMNVRRIELQELWVLAPFPVIQSQFPS